MAGNAFDNLNGIYLSDTFRAWFDKTNQIINTLNPLEIYGITNDQGEYAGITFTVGSDGIVTVGLDLPNSLTGDFTFVNGVTFAGFVNVSGSTVDFGGATLYGKVVRSINGQTGDVVFNTLTTPGGSVTGDILVYNRGGTYDGYRLFTDDYPLASGIDPLHVGEDGGVFFGVTSGGASAAAWLSKGEIQLVGSTSSAIYLTDNSLSTLTNSKFAGAEIRYEQEDGSNIFTIGGRNISGTRYGTKNLVLDFDNQSTSIGGALTGDGILNIGNLSDLTNIVVVEDRSGSTFSLSYFDPDEDGGRTSGGFTGLAAFGGNPASKGLKDDERIRLEYTAGSVEIEINGPNETSGFAVYGKDSSSYGDLLLPTLVARRDGNVVIGGVAPSDGGLTGTTFGGLNIASGKLLIGGTTGVQTSSGYQVLSSNGVTCGWRVLNSTTISLDGTVAIPAYAVLNTTSGSVSILGDTDVIDATDKDNNFITGPFSATIHMPTLMIDDYPGAGQIPNALVGVRMILDGNSEDKYFPWTDFYQNGIGQSKLINLSFSFSGKANTSVSFVPFATLGPFNYRTVGSYLINFNRLG